MNQSEIQLMQAVKKANEMEALSKRLRELLRNKDQEIAKLREKLFTYEQSKTILG